MSPPLFPPSFKDFDVISMVENSVVRGKAVVDLFSVTLTIFSFARKMEHKKEKTNCATITSFPWSVLLMAIALDQSERQIPQSFVKV